MTLYTLTKPQQSIWNMEKYYGGSIANITGSVIFTESVELSALQDAILKTVIQCDALRIRVINKDGIPMQYVKPNENLQCEITQFGNKEKFDAWINTLARTQCDLSNDLVKFVIFTIGQRIGFVIHLHHIIADAWTLYLITNTIMQNLRNETVRTSSYLEYLDVEREYNKSIRYEKDKSFFMSCLKQCSEPIYLSDKQTSNPAAARLSFTIHTNSAALIQKFCTDYGLSPYALFMNALAVYIYRIKGANEFYIGTTVLNRSGRKEKETAGMFINTVPVLFQINGNKNVLENIHENGKSLFGILRHQKYHYTDMLRDIREEHSFMDKLYDITLNYQNAALIYDELETQWHFCGCQGDSLSIHINDRQQEGVFHIDYDYQTELFNQRNIERLHGHMMNLVFDMMLNTNKKPHELNLLSDDEYNQVIFDFNDTAAIYPKDKCIHQLFEEQVEKTPDAVAVVFDDVEYTYRHINEMSNSLAYVLREKAVYRNDVVALIARRSYKIIVAQLAILKAGGAYLPIDPSYPEDRINFMIHDSKCKFALVLGANTVDANVIDLEDDNTFNQNCDAIENMNTPNDLCYVIYTSGSTGIPKGTMLTHKNVGNYCNNNNNVVNKIVNEDMKSIVSTTTIGFDIFVTESILPLLNGMKIVFANENQASVQGELNELVLRSKADVLQTTPSKMLMLMADETQIEYLGIIKAFILGGEALDTSVVDRLKMFSNGKIYNIYGPTETTVWSSTSECIEQTKNKCIHQLFDEQAKKTPNNIAINTEDVSLTYFELFNQSNSVASVLKQNGLDGNNLVAILLPRKSYLITAILGVLKSGGAYLPIDVDTPKNRVEYILNDANVKFIITIPDIQIKYGLTDSVLFIESIISDSNNLTYKSNTYDLCYCIYTSGSTGEPKGTLIENHNLSNYVNFSKVAYGEEQYNMPMLTDIGVDLTVTSIFLPLTTGGTVYVLDGEIENRLAQCTKNDINLIKLTPTHFELMKMLNKNAKEIKKIILGGEKITAELLSKVCSSTIIYDEYGPTETTVGSSVRMYIANSKEQINYDITIGKPIANTQIYILDKNLKPLPVGAAGELCISGDGVGRGYLNRPELTAEKFISNPFIEGKRMYRTGDLARWREDGQLEYIGRIDNQVKIRGLRIELGEIEAAINVYPGIKQTAVIVKTDESGRQYICAYYIGEDLDTQSIKSELLKKLPQYMVPHFFIKMELFPTTPSGKTDRKAFPTPNFTNIQTDTVYAAPVTEDEKALVMLMQKVLNIQQIGLNDNFFDLGGDSLKAIEFVSKAHHEGMLFNLQDVFDHPTAVLLLKHIMGGDKRNIQYNKDDFVQIHKMLENNRFIESEPPSKRAIGDVLITGATGWLGVHVLDEFLTVETGLAYCLVRGTDLQNSQYRLEAVLKDYFGNKYTDCTRIIVLCGDITEKIVVDKPIDTIIHCAANVKHYGSYKHSYDINVIGTRSVIAFAEEKGAKLLHISTASVSGNSFDQDPSFPPTIFNETKLFINQPLENVYVRSKFEAEATVLQARLDGLDAVIIRAGNLANRYADLKFQKNYQENATLTRLKAFVDLGVYPWQLSRFPIEFSPVDDTAKAIIKLAQRHSGKCSVFQVYNHKPVRFVDFVKALKSVGIKMKATTVRRFLHEVNKTVNQMEKSHIHKALIHDISADGKLRINSNITLCNEFSARYLKQIGFEWCDIGRAYLEGYIRYFNNIEHWSVQQ